MVDIGGHSGKREVGKSGRWLYMMETLYISKIYVCIE